MKNLLRPLLFYSGFHQSKIIRRRLTGRRAVFILNYHKVDYRVPPLFGVAVRPDVFERQMVFLKKHYRIADLGELGKLESDIEDKRDIVVITFDDGYRNNYTYAFPVLKKYGIPATIFLVTDYIDSHRLLWHDWLSWILYHAVSTAHDFTGTTSEMKHDIERFCSSGTAERLGLLYALAMKLKKLEKAERQNYLDTLAKACKVNRGLEYKDRAILSWNEIEEMSGAGISFGAHTKSHPVLSAISVPEAETEISESKKIIENRTQKRVTTFAYPYGKNEDFSTDIVDILVSEGFEYACTTNAGSEMFPISNPLRLKRKSNILAPYLLF